MPTRKNESILVTGASGFVGGHLLDRLRGNTEIIAWSGPGSTPRPVEGVRWQPVQLLNRLDVTRALDEHRPTQIYHLAGAPSVDTSFTNALPHLQINARGTSFLLDAVAALALDCRVLVVTSAQVYQFGSLALNEETPLVPNSPYGVSKLAQDMLARVAARSDQLDVVVARPFNHVGPRQRPAFSVASFARQIARIEAGLEQPLIRVGNLNADRDLTDVRDVVAAYELLMRRGQTGRAYNICSGMAWSMADVLQQLLHRSRVAIRVEVDPARMRPNDVPLILGDGTRLRQELGWRPTIALERTLDDVLAWWRSQTRDEG